MYTRYPSRYARLCYSRAHPSRIIQVDGPIGIYFQSFLEVSLAIIAKFGAVVIFSPIFAFPGVAVAILGVWGGNIYMKAQICVKREMSNARSPVLAHFGAAIAGIGALVTHRLELRPKFL